MAIVNYHNHTSRCGHATGTPEEYVKKAISLGVEEFGFSDHAPLPLFLRKGITMEPEECDDYLDEIVQLKETYKDKIKIKVGFEIDFPLYSTFDKKYLADKRIDYTIGSCHFIDDWPFDHSDYIDEFDKRNLDQVYKQYYAIILDAAESSMFNIIGHLDLVKKFGHKPSVLYSEEITAIGKAVIKNDMAIEINTSGLIKPVKEIYPSEDIINLLFKLNVPITLGSDSHAPEHICYGYDHALYIIKKAGYTKISGFTNRKRYDILL